MVRLKLSLSVVLGCGGTAGLARAESAEAPRFGGDVVVCQEGGASKTELLDYYEARVMRGLDIQMRQGATNFDEQAQAILTRFESYSKQQAKDYREMTYRFMQEARFSEDIQLVPNAGPFLAFVDGQMREIPIPANCSVQRVVAQDQPGASYKYVVDAHLWEALSERDKAGVLLHEVILRERTALGDRDSARTRFFGGLIAAEQLLSLSARDWMAVLTSLYGIDSVVFKDLPLVLVGMEFYPDGTLLMAQADEKLEGRVLGQGGKFRGVFRFHESGGLSEFTPARDFWVDILGGRVQLEHGQPAKIHANGVLASGRANYAGLSAQTDEYDMHCGEDFRIHPSGFLDVCYGRGQVVLNERVVDVFGDAAPHGQGLRFHEAGNLAYGILAKNVRFEFADIEAEVRSDRIYAYPSGAIRQARLHRSARLMHCSGDARIYASGSVLTFLENGQVCELSPN